MKKSTAWPYGVWHGAASWDHQANRKGEKLSVAEHRAEAAEEQAENIRESKLWMTLDDFRCGIIRSYAYAHTCAVRIYFVVYNSHSGLAGSMMKLYLGHTKPQFPNSMPQC